MVGIDLQVHKAVGVLSDPLPIVNGRVSQDSSDLLAISGIFFGEIETLKPRVNSDSKMTPGS